MQAVANVVQLIGALVTFVGLAHAYTRSAYGMGLGRWIMSKLRRSDVQLTGEGLLVGMGGTGTASVDVYAPFSLDTGQPVEDQLAHLAEYVRELRAMFPLIGQQFIQLQRDVADARAHAESVAGQALADAKKHLDDFKADQTRTDVLDLRVAIFGLFISFVGTALALGA